MKSLVEKHINILDYALSSIWRRRVKNGSVILIFAAVIFLVASFQMVSDALTRTASEVLIETPEITIQHMSAGRQEAIPQVYRERLKGIFGIKKIVPRIWGYYFDEVRGANFTVMGLDPGEMPRGEALSLAVAEGRLPKWGDGGGEVVVGRSIQRVLGLEPGRFFSFFRPDLSLKALRVTGIFDRRSDILTNDLILMNLNDARDLFAIPDGKVTDLCVSVYNPAEITTIAQKIAKILPDARVLTRPQIRKTYQVVFGWRSGFASVCLLAALAAFAILAWDKASGLSPEERREIAILKILGWETSDILEMRFWEGSLVSLFAFLIGCTTAYIHVVFFEASLFRPVLVGWSVIFPPFRLVPDLHFSAILLIFALTVLPYLAVTVVPAWRSAGVPPESALAG